LHEKASLGYERWAASIITPAFFMLLTWFAASGRKWFSLAGASVVFIGLQATIFPILTSSRSEVAILLIISMVIWHYMRKQIRARTLVWIAVTGIIVFMIMSALRKNTNSLSEIVPYLTGGKVVEALVANQNLLGIDKTARIINAVPNKLPYEYGSTLLLWLVAPIPRTIWKQKPIISAGEIIGQELYEPHFMQATGGVPPGILAELYWNFGFAGIFGGMFLLGCFLKLLYQSFRTELSKNKNILVIYLPFLVVFSFAIPGGNFSGAIVGLLINSFSTVILLWCIRTRPKEFQK
jgi:oligosaccharide repeat unit polymerase